jgi:hypothetical protein
VVVELGSECVAFAFVWLTAHRQIIKIVIKISIIFLYVLSWLPLKKCFLNFQFLFGLVLDYKASRRNQFYLVREIIQQRYTIMRPK